MNVLIIFCGEAFRCGNQHSRKINLEGEYYKNQLITTNSHLRLIEYIENKFKYNVSTALLFYNINDTINNMIIQMYKPIEYEIKESSSNWSRYDYYKYLSIRFKKLMTKFDFTIFIRIDQYIKKYFHECLNFDNTIKFSFPDVNSHFKDFIKNDKLDLKNIKYKINVDINILQISKKYYIFLFRHKLFCKCAGAYTFLLNEYKDINWYGRISFFTKYFFTADSSILWNPLYANTGRVENLNFTIVKKKRYKYNKDFYFEKNHTLKKSNIKTENLFRKLIYSEILPWSLK